MILATSLIHDLSNELKRLEKQDERVSLLEALVREIREELPVDDRDPTSHERQMAWIEKSKGLVP